jgi:hypothetical protein
VPEVKRTFNWLGKSLEVTEVPILKSDEHVHEYHLEDGAIIRVATPTMSVIRLDGVKDFQGNPTYLVHNGTTVTVIEGPKQKS